MGADFWFSAILNGILFYGAYKLGQFVMMKRAMELYGEELDEKETVIKLEKYPEGLFAYNAKDGSFIANHTDIRGLLIRIKDRYPGQSFRLNKPEWVTEAEYKDMFTAAVDVFGASKQ